MWRLSRLEADSARNADLVVTISRYSFRKLIQLYDVEKSRIRIVPNGVDTERFVPDRGGVNLKHQIGVENRPVVLFVGRLIPRKGLMYLAEAARVVAREFNEVAFLVVGSGPLKKRMLSYLKQVDLMDNFVFLGDVSEASLPSLYACSDIFVLPSIQEGQGIAFLEAQASGKPVVAFDVGGVGEALQDGKTGLLVKPGSQNLAEALLKLLSDATLREKMGLSGRDYVSNNLSWDVCAKRMIEVYREASSFV
ncbi:TPA: glycosyltransferase family 4 protein [Candidatus Bathyarchaeota archaeon]|nr:glycosyltransferase family 4 protein [Candidatus Bathyarchaeota archaeon]